MDPGISISLQNLLKGCQENDRQSQRMLYQHFYGYAMNICLRYTANRTEATEVLNEGFLKVFTKIEMYNQEKSLKGWIRRIMINSAIDYYRQNSRHTNNNSDIENAMKVSEQETVSSKLSYDEILTEIQALSPAYRTVFNLYVIDGFTHEEIAGQLGISVGTSKSNLFKAKALLQKRLTKIYDHEQAPGVAKR
ncbi:sigma-70 family RNA polymerase sigma factor [Cesiribacter sp. SM1]|uniref:RNA polymerase sigma factor n=1 Tax=Cesiribacter sp. SM1 TaxID=2861196 RepID=UPI001CD50E9A